MRFILTVLLALALSACANPYLTYYRSVDPAPSGPLKVVEGRSSTLGQIDAEIQTYRAAGYTLLGCSSFSVARGGNFMSALEKAAEKIGADFVVTAAGRSGERQVMIPVVTTSGPQISTTTTQATGSATATHGISTVDVSGRATVTSQTITAPSTTVTNIPGTVDEYTFVAAFFRKP